MSLAKFTEEFLDVLVEETFKIQLTKSHCTNSMKILQEILSLFETDRLIFKFYNRLVAKFFDENKAIIK